MPSSTGEDVENAVQAASDAFENWSETTVTERAQFMMKIADLIDQNLGKLH